MDQGDSEASIVSKFACQDVHSDAFVRQRLENPARATAHIEDWALSSRELANDTESLSLPVPLQGYEAVVRARSWLVSAAATEFLRLQSFQKARIYAYPSRPSRAEEVPCRRG